MASLCRISKLSQFVCHSWLGLWQFYESVLWFLIRLDNVHINEHRQYKCQGKGQKKGMIVFFWRFSGEHIWLAAGGGCQPVCVHLWNTVLAWQRTTGATLPPFGSCSSTFAGREACHEHLCVTSVGFIWLHHKSLFWNNLLHYRKRTDLDRHLVRPPF